MWCISALRSSRETSGWLSAMPSRASFSLSCFALARFSCRSRFSVRLSFPAAASSYHFADRCALAVQISSCRHKAAIRPLELF